MDNACSKTQLEIINDSLRTGNALMAEVVYRQCQGNIKDQDPSLRGHRQLQDKFNGAGISQSEMIKMEELKTSGESSIAQRNVELLHTVQKKQKPDDICKIDFDQHGNPYKGDVAITCKK